MRNQGSVSVEFKKQVVEGLLSGEIRPVGSDVDNS